jgi:hypothetical protein
VVSEIKRIKIKKIILQLLEALIKILGLEKNRFLIPNLKKIIMMYLLNSKKLQD